MQPRAESGANVYGGGNRSKKRDWCAKSPTGRGNLVLALLVAIFFASCSGAKVYTRRDAATYAAKHKTLAILPPEIKMEVKKKDNISNKHEQGKVETVNAQNEMYSRMLRFIQKGKMDIEIQDIEKTNAMLLKIGYPVGESASMTSEELAQALGVDAIWQTSYVFSSQRHVAGGIAYAVIFFPYGTYWGIMMAAQPTNFADVNVKLYDGATGHLLYSYNNKFSGLGVKYVILVDGATKKAGKKSPYY
jgi:hypothetical protein